MVLCAHIIVLFNKSKNSAWINQSIVCSDGISAKAPPNMVFLQCCPEINNLLKGQWTAETHFSCSPLDSTGT
ncbi:hypothetical protein E2320_015603 [Naja naja]|nr:hypothetical protein E2320_015603 [Naja naja]